MDLDPMISILAAGLKYAYNALMRRLREIVASMTTDGKIPAGDALYIVRARNALEQVKGSDLQRMLGIALTKKQNALSRVVASVLEESQAAGLPSEFTRVGRNVIDALGKITDDQVRELVSGVTDEMTRYVMQTVISGGPADKLLNQIATKLDIRSDQAETVAEAMVAGFERSLTIQQAKEAGVEVFAYLGPDDGITRPWCQHWAGRSGTSEEFEDTSDEWGRDRQPMPVMTYGGGYNCRHRFVPLPLAEQRAKYPRGPDRSRGEEDAE